MSLLKLSHALIKHKDFTNYILPRPNHLPNHIDLSQLSPQIHSSQIMNLYHIPLIITSQYKLNRWTNPFQLFDLFELVWCVYDCAISCAIVVRRVTCLVERREAILFSRKASDTHVPYPFYYALVYSPLVVRMIGVLLNCFIKCLDPSSV
jgi:hypothetical protein